MDVKMVRLPELGSLLKQGYKIVAWAYFYETRENVLVTVEKPFSEQDN